MAKTEKKTATKTATPPKPIRLRIKLGVSKAPGLNGTVWIENVEFDGPRTSLLFGRYYKVCVYVNEKTKTVVPVLYLDNGNYGGVVECRHMSGGAPNCIPMVDRTPHGNLIEFAYVAEDLLKAVAAQSLAQPAPAAAAPAPAATNGGPATAKKKPAPEPEPEADEDEDEAEAEGDAEEGDDEEGDEAEAEGGDEEGDEEAGDDDDAEAEGDSEEGDEEGDDEGDPDFATLSREALIDAAGQLKKEGHGVPWSKDWSDAKLRKAVEEAYEKWQASDDATEGDEDDAESEDEGEDEGSEDESGEAEGDEGEEEAAAPPPKKPATGKKPLKKKKVKK